MILNFMLLGVRHRSSVLFAFFIITTFALSGMYRLQIDTGVDSLIPPSDPARLIYQQVMDQFGTDNKTIVYVKDANLWTPGKLSFVLFLAPKSRAQHRVARRNDVVERVSEDVT